MSWIWIPVGAGLAVFLSLIGLREFLIFFRKRKQYIKGADYLFEPQLVFENALASWNNQFRRTRVGRWIETELELAGITVMPLVVVFLTLLAGAALTWVIGYFLAPLLAIFGLLAAFLLVRSYLRRSQQRRQEAIIAQLPELARVLANATFAGLSLPAALVVSSKELTEPIHSELVRVCDRLRFGASAEAALKEFGDRVRSRETGVLISALVVSIRTGGSMVTALRGIAENLEQRKDTRRKIKTTLSGPLVTANLILVISVGSLAMLNLLQPDTVEKMTRSPLGIAAMVVSGVLFASGYIAIRRMARVEL